MNRALPPMLSRSFPGLAAIGLLMAVGLAEESTPVEPQPAPQRSPLAEAANKFKPDGWEAAASLKKDEWSEINKKLIKTFDLNTKVPPPIDPGRISRDFKAEPPATQGLLLSSSFHLYNTLAGKSPAGAKATIHEFYARARAFGIYYPIWRRNAGGESIDSQLATLARDAEKNSNEAGIALEAAQKRVNASTEQAEHAPANAKVAAQKSLDEAISSRDKARTERTRLEKLSAQAKKNIEDIRSQANGVFRGWLSVSREQQRIAPSLLASEIIHWQAEWLTEEASVQRCQGLLSDAFPGWAESKDHDDWTVAQKDALGHYYSILQSVRGKRWSVTNQSLVNDLRHLEELFSKQQ